MRVRMIAVLVIALACNACSLDGAPDGYEAVAANDARGSANACPDLSGSYDLTAGDATLFLDQPKPENKGHRILLSVPPSAANSGSALREAYWAMDREALLAFAKALRDRDSEAYARWRSLLLREHLHPDLVGNADKWRAEVHRRGPFFAVPAGLVIRQCKDHWALVKTEMSANWSQEQEVWLGRNREGALLFKIVTYDLTSYTVWGDSTSFLRSNARRRWHSVPGAAAINTAALTAADLAPAPADARPAETCVDPVSRLVEASQFLQTHLPSGAELKYFQPRTDGRSANNFLCRMIPVDVTLGLRGIADFRSLELAIEQQSGLRLERLNFPSAADAEAVVSFSLVVDLD